MMKEKDDNKEITTKKSSTSFVWLVTLAIVFSLGGSLVGAFWAKSLFLSKAFPLLGNEISVSQDSLRRANLIIENAKKIVVEQDNKVQETIASGRNSIVGIFKKKVEEEGKATSSKPFTAADHYRIDEEESEGLIVTSDGWIIASGLPKGMTNEAVIKEYVVITRSRNVYEIDKVLKTGVEPYVFLHLAAAKDLPVKGLASFESLSESQLLVAVDWEGRSYLSSLFEKERPKDLIRFSDAPSKKMTMSDSFEGFFDSAFLFSLNGEAAAMFDKGSGIVAIDTFLPIINGLLEKKDVKYSSLGVYYIDLSSLSIKDPRYEKGAMIQPEGKKSGIEVGGAAAEAGLKDGDVILSINNIKIDANNDLANVIRKYPAGEEVNILYLRGDQENMVKVKLKELKINQTKI